MVTITVLQQIAVFSYLLQQMDLRTEEWNCHCLGVLGWAQEWDEFVERHLSSPQESVFP